MLFYIISLVLLVAGSGGLTRFFMKKQRSEQITRLLQQDGQRQQKDMLSPDNITPVERIMQKSSRVVSLSAMLDKNVYAKGVTAVGLIIVFLLGNLLGIYNLSAQTLLVCSFIIFAVILLLPNIVKGFAMKKSVKSISDDLPFAIDLMAVCIQSGMTVEKAIRYIASNFYSINPAIATLFERAVLKTEVNGISAALDQIYEEVPGKEVKMLCSTLQQSIKYGSSVYQVLIDLSQEIRELQLLSTEEKVASLSAKMTFPMIGLIMFPLLAIVAGPGIIRMASQWGS